MRISVTPGVRAVNNRMTSVTTLVFPHPVQSLFNAGCSWFPFYHLWPIDD